jgi:S-adenosylmethionine:tRNA ribosyltransferase-isomerase
VFEIFLLRPENNTWLALAKPGRKLKIDDILDFGGVTAKVIEKQEGGIVRLDFSLPIEKVFEFAEAHGQVPTPPYVKDPPKDEKYYQTIYANKLGSAAAPTAGFHFTPELMESLKKQGIKFATVTLHVGLGTFRPIMTEEIEQHVMHQEWIEVTQETCDLIKQTKESGHRVIAVGTTSVRTLESAYRLDPFVSSDETSPLRRETQPKNKILKPFAGFTDLFLKSGDAFHIVDALITNFHLPESTLLVLVSAFAQSKMQVPDQGRRFVLKAYSEAIKNEYRFYSFGDAMFIA